MASPWRLLPVLPLCLLLAACSSTTSSAAKPTSAATPAVLVATLTPTRTAAATATAPATTIVVTPTASPTAEPTATAPPLPGPPVPALELRPAEVPQGGVGLIVLHTPAASATATFLERQYPMLRDGDDLWAIVGVGAIVDPGPHPVSVSLVPADGGAATTVTADLTVVDVDYPVGYIELDDATAALLDPAIVQAELNTRASIYGGYTLERLWSGPFVVPATAPLSSLYGEGRSYNGGPVTDYHRGTDFAGQEGDPVAAAATGRVVFAEALQVRGNSVIIDHGAGVFTAYHHLSRIDVAVGDLVSAGQQIGLIGSTGLVTGPHLHWEVIVRGVEVDGRLWLQGNAIGP